MNELSKQIDIAKHVIDGSITIDSVNEFEGILQIFPKDPELHRAFSDLLMRKKQYGKAAAAYHKSAELFISSGKILPALMCKRLQWRMQKPSRDEAIQFYNALLKGSYHETSLKAFLSRLSFSELIALMNYMQRLYLPAGQTVKKIGDSEKAMFLVVSGNLVSTIYQPLKKNESNHQKSTVQLSENDFFGSIYPFEKEKVSQAHIETSSRVELVKLSKPQLIKLCKKYPNIELGIIDLVKARANGNDTGTWRSVRKTERHQLPLRMNLKIYPDATSHHPVVLDGYSKDVSVGGMCIVLDAKYANIPAVYKSIQNAKIEISLPGEALTISVTAAIAWSKEVYQEGQKTVALGIEFEEMSPKLSGLLVVFADILSDQE
jgi:CRP-like cAMP-binding protein